MSKKSRRRNKMLLAGAALLGASKLGMLRGKTQLQDDTSLSKDAAKVTKSKPIC